MPEPFLCEGCTHYNVGVCRAGHADIMRRIEASGGECLHFESVEEEEAEREKIADMLVGLAQGKIVELFMDQRDDAFAAIGTGGHVEVHPIRGRRFGSWLRRLYFEAEGTALKAETLRDAVATLESIALFGKDLKIRHLENRVAWRDGKIYYDLTDEGWRAVEVGGGGWKIVDKPPILFRRFQHQVEQVEPKEGGDLDDIFKFVNIAAEDDRLIFKCQLVASLVPGIPHPIIVFLGPQGCGKSLTMKAQRELIDSSSIPLLSFSHDREEIALMLHQHYAAYFDNVSKIKFWISDILCRACTGDGFTKRRLYTDEDAVILSFKRCVGLNGIAVPLERPDLLDRCLTFRLKQIEQIERAEEVRLIGEFNVLKPRILGAMFDVLSRAMKIYPTVEVKPLPRMADFARWGEAISRAMGREPGEFIRAYRGKLGEQTLDVLQEHPVGLAVLSFMEPREGWEGKPTELLNNLSEIAVDQNLDMKSECWPKNAVWLTRRLKEIETNLEQEGIRIDFGHGKGRIITLIKAKAQRPPLEQPVSPSGQDFTVDTVLPSPEEAEGVKSPKGARITADSKADSKMDNGKIPSAPKRGIHPPKSGPADSKTVSTVKSEPLGGEGMAPGQLPGGIVSAVRELIRQLAPKRGMLVDKRRLKGLASKQSIKGELVDRIIEHEETYGRLIDRGRRVEPVYR